MLELNHKKMDVWKESMKFSKKIYDLTKKFPKSEVYGIVSQMRRSSVSIPSNISEGASRFSRKERIRFFEIARSSLVELDTQLELSQELGFWNPEQDEEISREINILFAMLSNLIAKAR